MFETMATKYWQAFVALVILYIIFFIWMFVDMLQHTKGREKGQWILLFIISSGLSSIIWYFCRGKRK